MSLEHFKLLCGQTDENLKILKQVYKVNFVFRGDELIVDSDDQTILDQLQKTIDALIRLVKTNQTIDERDIIYLSQCVKHNQTEDFFKVNNHIIGRNQLGKPIYIKTLGQQAFYDAMQNYNLVFSMGPAGTGKTYLSVVFAVNMLKKGDIKRIILTRPVVEAGESLGYLPGDLKEKIDPYLRPLYDSLHDLLGTEQVDKLIEKGIIEIAPLAYMRGRTLEDACVILDEAQNTTKAQMLMFLTRMGFNTKMIINGDETQIDIKQDSGLKHAKSALKGYKDIHFSFLTTLDIVRNPLVQLIIEAYKKE
jgi:phosphate starvation-inducible PhoH-like protein